MDERALGTAIAGGAIATALLEALFAKGLLNLDEARGVLDHASRTVGTHYRAEGAFQATQIIGDLMRGRFSARGAAP
jgi:hypothetical protein